jgi:hypothetical protein
VAPAASDSVCSVRGKAFTLALAGVMALVCGGTASAIAVERIPLANSARPETAGFPPGVFLTLVSPADYWARSPGNWIGPAFWPSGDPAQRSESVIDWSVTFRDRSVEVSSAAAAVTQRGWREQERAGIAVPHVVGKTVLGTLPGHFVLKHSDAAHETALGIPLSPGAMAIIKFSFHSPAKNSAEPFGENYVNGTFLASTWNRGQAFVALSGVSVEGNLPPAKASLRALRRKAAVQGKVVDAFDHPLVGVRVTVERQAGAGWRRAGSARTNAQGSFTFSARGGGTYRATAAYAGVTVRSAAARVIAARATGK